MLFYNKNEELIRVTSHYLLPLSPAYTILLYGQLRKTLPCNKTKYIYKYGKRDMIEINLLTIVLAELCIKHCLGE